MKDQINTIREFFLLPVPHSPQDTLEYGRAKVRAEIAVSQIEAAVGEPVAFVTDADVACFGKGAQGEIVALLHRQGKWCHPLFTAAPVAQQPQYPLPDDLYPESKDWAAGAYAERVEWLHTMYESQKALVAEYERQFDQQPQANTVKVGFRGTGNPAELMDFAELVQPQAEAVPKTGDCL